MKTFTVPPSKSHSQRALLFAMMGQGKSRISNLLGSPDIDAMLRAIELFGAKWELFENYIEIEGGFEPPTDIIDAGNSGQILRFIGALSALLPGYTEITGDASIRSRRPVKPLLSALRMLGAIAESECGNDCAPILIRGPIHPGKCRLNGEDSQPVSALLIATSFLNGPSEIVVENPGETPWIDLTLDWLKRLGAKVSHENYSYYRIEGGLHYKGFQYTVPGDYSSAAFPIAASLVTQNPIKLQGLSKHDIQGDKIVIDILKKMGANIFWKDEFLIVEPSTLCGIAIDVNQCIDALPILATLGCFAKGTTRLYNGQIARKKESDRIAAIAKELKKMGGNVKEKEDGLIICESTLNGATLDSHRDHRIALSLVVATMGAKGSSTLENSECIAKTYPTFIEEMQQLGENLELDLVRI